MCPMLLNGLSDGPAMVLSPTQQHAFVQFPRHFDSAPGTNSGSLFANGFKSHTSPGASPSTKLATSAPIAGKPSRKRSRDEAAFEEAMNTPSAPVQAAPAPPPKEEEPVYGEGMVLLNPRTGMALSAESQTGTWYEEVSETTATASAGSSQPQAAGSSSLAGRKSQRLDPSAPSYDDIALSSMQRLQDASGDDNRRNLNSNPFTSGEPLVDDATRLLGISWQRIGMDDNDMAAAVRGWKKYIDRQFSSYLSDCEILMKNRALNAYLVTARPVSPFGLASSPAFYLFNDDLTQGQLVNSTWENTVHNLRSTPIIFEGAQVLNAASRPMTQNQDNVLGSNPADAGLPLLQTMSAQPVGGGCAGLNNGVGMGTGMEIDA
ncbi:hypothetical protein P170DRAFT_123367 [Aspergillus steynii IBT 23096]|uniref:Uncharacterized protein n=1 Tax=Aspergillus steynii IBT 23096 TaxID=1392250 RepID=A0A2I2GJR1_9EURO|nr:uncharacterized protein P170DRAFT_123367 [Aspergillus steynii IBT 23096]PLB53110.1 hypothetical protein P170DRAFT_123367 [Aspergillus steynii IBT 23096]